MRFTKNNKNSPPAPPPPPLRRSLRRRTVKHVAVKIKRVRDLKYIRTADNILVFNILVSHCGPLLGQQHLYEYFKKFGKIKHIEVECGRTRAQDSQCRIYFESPKAATAAIRRQNHSINSQSVKVKGCPSWEQPFQIDDPPPTYNGSSLLSLNYYCLEAIFHKLNFPEQVRLSLCHPRLEQVFSEMICPRRGDTLTLSDVRSFTNWEVRQSLRTLGPHVKRLVVPPNVLQSTAYAWITPHLNLYDYMYRHCVNVRSLHIYRNRFGYGNFMQSLRMNLITEMDLYDCDLYDSHLLLFTQLTKLTSLGLGLNMQLTGAGLTRFRSLKRLSLFGCAQVKAHNLLEACQALKLEYLDIRQALDAFQPAMDSCKELRTLRFTVPYLHRYNGDFESFANTKVLPKLTSLHIHSEFMAPSAMFYNKLVQSHADDLLELKLTGHPHIVLPTVAASIACLRNLRLLWLGENKHNITKSALNSFAKLQNLEELCLSNVQSVTGQQILHVIRECKKLKRLSLRKYYRLTVDFIKDLINVLEQRQSEPKAKNNLFKLVFLGNHSIDERLLKSDLYLNVKHLLDLSFNPNLPIAGTVSELSMFDGRVDSSLSLEFQAQNGSINSDYSSNSDSEFSDGSSYYDSDVDFFFVY